MKNKNKQKTVLIRSVQPSTNKTLNDYLAKGWIVKQIVPMGESGNALVLIEQEKEDEKKPLGFK